MGYRIIENIESQSETKFFKNFGVHNSFEARFCQNYILLICGGGTGFALKKEKKFIRGGADDYEWFSDYVDILKNFTEEDVIKYCITNKWYYFNYYTYQIEEL